MKHINLEIKIRGIENWSVDWDDIPSRQRALKDLYRDVKFELVKLGIDEDNIDIEIDLREN